jgi:deoxyhypusine synthase
LVSATAANHEESYYRYVAHSHYAYIPRYTELTPEQEAELRDAGLRRITDTFLPEDESVRIMEPHLLKMWKEAQKKGERYFPHEYFRRLFKQGLIKPDPKANENDCWTYAAFKKNVPIVIPGFEDSTMGNIFASYCVTGELKASTMKSGIEYMVWLADWYTKNSGKDGIGFFQVGGGIAGDFPICVVPMLHQDLERDGVPFWSYFCQISDSTTSYGSYSGAVPNEKITWGKLSIDTPKFIVESDATIVAPLMFAYILDM